MLDPRIISTVKRYLEYGWNTAVIQSLIRRQFNAPISVKCIRNIKDGKKCTAKCIENCPVKDAELWFVPDFSDLQRNPSD